MHTKKIKIMNNLVNEIYSQGNIPNIVSFPELMIIALTTRCNYNCIMCNEWKKDPVDVSEKLMGEVRGMLPFLNRIHITGGEPMLHKGIWDFIAECSQNHVNVSIVSNGSLLTDDKIEKLLDLGVKNIKFSLDAATQKTYSKIRHANLFKVLGNIGRLTQAKARRKSTYPLIELGFVAMRMNIHELSKVVVLAHELGCHSVRAAHLFQGADGMEGQSLRQDKDLSDAEMLKAAAIAKKLGVVLKVPKLFNASGSKNNDEKASASGASFLEIQKCTEPWRTMFLFADGETNLCCYGAAGGFGNLEELGFDALWNNAKRQEVRRQINTDNPPRACRGCVVYPNMTAKMKSKTAS